jgi:hypothetical protein
MILQRDYFSLLAADVKMNGELIKGDQWMDRYGANGIVE